MVYKQLVCPGSSFQQYLFSGKPDGPKLSWSQTGGLQKCLLSGHSPPEEVTLVRPPSGDPYSAKDEYWLLQKTLYGLWCSPCHLYEKIDSILHSNGLVPNIHKPCFYTGCMWDPLHMSASHASIPLSIGLYVDDFVYFSEDPAVETLFKLHLQERVKVNFIGLVEWFLGIDFSWCITPLWDDVHLNQTGFAANLVEQFCHDSWDPTFMAMPYCLGIPIDSITGSSDKDDSPSQL